MVNELYARIENGQVVQFPVTIDDINARNNPTDIYYRCYYKAHYPIIPIKLSEKIIETPWILGHVVYVEEYRTTKTVEELFQYLATVAVSFDEQGQPFIDRNLITMEIFSAFEEVVKIRVQELLDAFARTRGYDDMKSLCSYVSDSDPQFSSEGSRGVYLRGTTWNTLYTYFFNIMNNVEPVPVSWEEIAAKLPPLTWEPAP